MTGFKFGTYAEYIITAGFFSIQCHSDCHDLFVTCPACKDQPLGEYAGCGSDNAVCDRRWQRNLFVLLFCDARDCGHVDDLVVRLERTWQDSLKAQISLRLEPSCGFGTSQPPFKTVEK